MTTAHLCQQLGDLVALSLHAHLSLLQAILQVGHFWAAADVLPDTHMHSARELAFELQSGIVDRPASGYAKRV